VIQSVKKVVIFMIDKRSKQLLDFMISKPNSSFNYIDDEYPDEFGDSNQFRSSALPLVLVSQYCQQF